MQQPIPKIKIQSPVQVQDSIREKQVKDVFKSSTYAGLNRFSPLSSTTPPIEFYEANDETPNNTFYHTAIDDTPSLEDEDEPPYIDLDKELKPSSVQNINKTFYNSAPKFYQISDASSPFPQSPLQFSTPQASSTKRYDLESISEDMNTVHIELTDLEDLVCDPYCSSILSDIIDGISVESESDYKKYSLIELFDRLCMKEQDAFRELMQSKGETGDLAKIDLENLDYETTFVDLSAETSKQPPNSVSSAINCLTRAEIKNEIYRAMTKDKSGKLNFNIGSEAKSTTFIPDIKGNIEILTYLGSTGRDSQNNFCRAGNTPQSGDNLSSEIFDDTFNQSDTGERNLGQSSLEPKNLMSRWGNVSNLAGSP